MTLVLMHAWLTASKPSGVICRKDGNVLWIRSWDIKKVEFWHQLIAIIKHDVF